MGFLSLNQWNSGFFSPYFHLFTINKTPWTLDVYFYDLKSISNHNNLNSIDLKCQTAEFV